MRMARTLHSPLVTREPTRHKERAGVEPLGDEREGQLSFELGDLPLGFDACLASDGTFSLTAFHEKQRVAHIQAARRKNPR
jgi:hypothetical protein